MVSPQVHKIEWELVSHLTMWHILAGECKLHLFHNTDEPPEETIQHIWADLLHTLSGQYESLLHPKLK